jgi:hypothetical protein
MGKKINRELAIARLSKRIKMTKIQVPCSCGCGKMVKRKEADVSKPGAMFFVNKKHAGAFYTRTGFLRGAQVRGRRREAFA